MFWWQRYPQSAAQRHKAISLFLWHGKPCAVEMIWWSFWTLVQWGIVVLWSYKIHTSIREISISAFISWKVHVDIFIVAAVFFYSVYGVKPLQLIYKQAQRLTHHKLLPCCRWYKDPHYKPNHLWGLCHSLIVFLPLAMGNIHMQYFCTCKVDYVIFFITVIPYSRCCFVYVWFVLLQRLRHLCAQSKTNFPTGTVRYSISYRT